MAVPQDPITYTTVSNGETPAHIAAQLAAAVFAQGILGITVTPPLQNTFKVTGPSDGTTFTSLVNSSSGRATVTDVTLPAGAPAILRDPSYDASGFTALTVGQTAGDVAFTNVAAGTTLTVTASQGGNHIVNYLLANSAGLNDSLNLTVGVDGTPKVLGGNGTGTITTTIATTGIENLNVASLGEVKDVTGAVQTNDVTIGDTAAKTVTITGDQAITLRLSTDANSPLSEAASSVTKIDASGSSGAVDVTGVALKNGVAHTILGGSGVLTAVGGSNAADVDTITTGSGGGVITLGSGGEFVAGGIFSNGAYSGGSETINLGASAAKTDTLNVADGAVATFNSTQGGVNGFGIGVTNSDQLTYESVVGGIETKDPKTIVANTVGTSPKLFSTLGLSAQAMAWSFDDTGALWTRLSGDLAYSIVNGVINFVAAAGHQLSDLSAGDLLRAAEIIVNEVGGNRIAAFSTGGTTYVVADDGAQTLLNTSGLGSHNDADSIVQLNGVASVAGFGTTGAGNTVTVTDVVNQVSSSLNTGTQTAQVYDDTGFALENRAASVSSATSLHGLNSYTFNNLAASATLQVDSVTPPSRTSVTW